MLEGTSSVVGSVSRFQAAVSGLVVLVAGVGLYGFHEHNVSKQLAAQNTTLNAQNTTLNAALNTTRDQLNAVSSRVDALNAQVVAAEKPAPPPPDVYRKPMNARSSRHRTEDPRWKKMQGQLDDQAKQIDATRQDLVSARTELQGSIATTHDELVLLEKKGERSYYEFDLDKSKQFQREGPVGVRLAKANTKREYADLEMMVDDFKVSKKHVNIYESVMFYSADSKRPMELVINAISKNHIHGYVSEPKYKGSDLEASANSSVTGVPASANGTPADLNAKPSPARQRLDVPKN
jgi:uncharacterized coiled-coil protein SlyX